MPIKNKIRNQVVFWRDIAHRNVQPFIQVQYTLAQCKEKYDKLMGSLEPEEKFICLANVVQEEFPPFLEMNMATVTLGNPENTMLRSRN